MAASGYQDGFDRGFADGKSHQDRKSRPAFFKSLFSNKYLSQYSKGYKDGHYSGVSEARAQEMRRIRRAGQTQEKDRER
jgi:hypothetical protein